MTSTITSTIDINQSRVVAAARQGLIAADAHYHAWDSTHQELFRATMDNATLTKVQRVLLYRLLGIKCNDATVEDAWNEVEPPELDILNWASLLTLGIGEDFIYLNESMAKGKSLLDFTTLYDYDYDDHLFQEQAKNLSILDYESSNYYAYKHPSWVRLLINKKFYYATFVSLATHLTDAIEEAGNSLIDDLLPHQYIEGKNNGKPEGSGFLWDMKIDAEGQEGQLEELKQRWYDYLQKRWTTLSQDCVQAPAAIYSKDTDTGDGPHRLFIFNNEAAITAVRWRYFLSDCKPLIGSYSQVENQLKQEVTCAQAFIADSHQDIQTNFNPNIINFRKKTKIIITAEALDDMTTLGGDDELDD